jgi:hypothetical protein
LRNFWRNSEKFLFGNLSAFAAIARNSRAISPPGMGAKKAPIIDRRLGPKIGAKMLALLHAWMSGDRANADRLIDELRKAGVEVRLVRGSMIRARVRDGEFTGPTAPAKWRLPTAAVAEQVQPRRKQAAALMSPLLITQSEAAELFRISKRMLAEMTQPNGPISAIRISRTCVRYSFAALQDAIPALEEWAETRQRGGSLRG